MSAQRLVTFGHSTANLERIAELLRGAGVRQLVDVRSAPGSRHNPDVALAELGRRLPRLGVDYRWEKRLGGWRKARPDAPDLALRHRAFAGYAAHMRSHQFRQAVDALLADADARRVAIMCAEALWWRCHRKMIADFLVVARGWRVLHLLHDASLHEHVPSSEVRLVPETGLLIYDCLT